MAWWSVDLAGTQWAYQPCMMGWAHTHSAVSIYLCCRYAGTAWWSVDLGGQYTIGMVAITNRLDCCGEQILTMFRNIFHTQTDWKLSIEL